jgi:uncharacterized protein (TIGR02246 family)
MATITPSSARSTSPSVTPPDADRSDIDALIALVAEVERTQRQEDVEGFLALFDRDAVWVTGGGIRLIGLDAISDFTRDVLPGAMADGSVTYEVEHLAFIRPDVALVGVQQQYLDRDGRPRPGWSRGLPSYVCARTADGWRIVAGQNTGVVDDDEI